jgi:DMSO/TMAO reductase YedYZ molybdopterin-dependent catalytic subunit
METDTAPSPRRADDPATSVPGKEGLLPRSHCFINLETPVDLLTEWITPVKHFYVRDHLFEPAGLNAAEWRLTIRGEVEKPLTLTLADLEQIPIHSVTNAFECAGNGRLLLDPKVPGTQWHKGAVGNAHFSGPTLRSLLQKAGIKDSARHVHFCGLDWARGEVPPFIRSIPIEKALHADTLIATHMNGERLTMHHGYPARALTPGWVGAASCKWLSEITVLDKPSEDYFMSEDYRLPNTPGKPGEPIPLEDTQPLTELTVKSLIATPGDGACLQPGAHAIQGFAWAGEADVTRVDISTDGGVTWHAAQLGKDHAKYAWRQWSHHWNPSRSGDYVILSRATDSQGRVQPDTPVWNPGGYLNNACDRVKVYVQA